MLIKNKLNDYKTPSHNRLTDILVTLHTSDIELTTSFYESVTHRMIPFNWEDSNLSKHVLDNGLWWNLVDYCININDNCSMWHFKRVSGAPYKNMQQFIENFRAGSGVRVSVSVSARELIK